VAKQTGPGYAVKGGVKLALAGAVIVALSACAGTTWHHPHKVGQVASDDERACAQEAEETALQRSSKQRVEYGRPRPSSIPGLNRGETPMELLDRSTTEDTYRFEFESCMKSKGYTQGDKDKP